MNFEPVEWSPSGAESLYRSYETTVDPAQPACLVEDTASFRYHILPTDGSPPIDVADVAGARRRWYGDQALEYRCGANVVIQPYCDTPSGPPDPTDVYVGSTLLVSARDFRLISKPSR